MLSLLKYTAQNLYRKQLPNKIKIVNNKYYEYQLEFFDEESCGFIAWKAIRQYGKLESPVDGSASLVNYDSSGRIWQRRWHEGGALYRNSGPALERIEPETDKVVYQEYRKKGELHRALPEPAVIWRDAKSGSIIATSFFLNGVEVEPPTPNAIDFEP